MDVVIQQMANDVRVRFGAGVNKRRVYSEPYQLIKRIRNTRDPILF
jgi:hypothetical protein